ncbi:cobalt ABC transporter permease, partial [Escherichia coli]|nr:cobalt ABC transporter permease [Escherichia coli]
QLVWGMKDTFTLLLFILLTALLVLLRN